MSIDKISGQDAGRALVSARIIEQMRAGTASRGRLRRATTGKKRCVARRSVYVRGVFPIRMRGALTSGS